MQKDVFYRAVPLSSLTEYIEALYEETVFDENYEFQAEDTEIISLDPVCVTIPELHIDAYEGCMLELDDDTGEYYPD